jgi:hypothetical protein
LILVVVVVLVLEAARFIADTFEYEDEDRCAEDEDDLSLHLRRLNRRSVRQPRLVEDADEDAAR